jgi:hypothetical protein
MNKRLLLIGLVLPFVYGNMLGQEWKRIYGGSLNTYTNCIYEQYDRGYLLSGMQYDNTYHPYGLIMKTDINGFLKWSKSYGLPLKYFNFFGARTTTDGGMIEIGITDKIQTGCNDPLVLKINACGEKEWCKIYNSPNCNSVGMDIEIAPDNGYIALIDGWHSGEQEKTWLFHMDAMGEMIWVQKYATNPDFWSEESHSLLKTSDSCFVITGEAYYPDSTYRTKKIIKIILIKVALDGTSTFEVPWGANNGVYSDGRLSAIDSKNNLYTAGRRARTITPTGDSPCFFKTYSNGSPAFYRDLKSTSALGTSTTINWFQDSTLVHCMYWGAEVGVDTTGLLKTDLDGNTMIQKALLINSTCSFYGSDITYDNKLILAGRVFEGGVYHTYAYKLTSNLDYDSMYTTPFTYDSLCPHPIVSDTIPLDDCQTVVVGLDDAEKNPEKARLHIYPNPAGGDVAIEMPQYLVRKNTGNGITATTTWFQWNQTRLDIFDLTGKLMFSQNIPKPQTTVKLNVSAWPAGMYLARVVFMNEVAAEAKFLKQ